MDDQLITDEMCEVVLTKSMQTDELAGKGVGWATRSPDLTPLDYFLWGAMKPKVYRTTVNTEAELKDRIVQCTHEIKSEPRLVRRATNQIALRVAMCLHQRGGYFEH
ncbi:unnamed protein product [Euphydryas editha]|uniref:Uncharacterized protein n=1 Tax=Euphydryas editha TaxID=104508 RepID=A0AAU9TRJ8_EUPED|nr:unnamed protein product [Euphydryas editha]